MNNKVALSLAGVMAAATFAPQASALPLFARQTGMACNACHFQHFPMLNSFGRSFKASGYTLMGAEGKVEGDNLSIPDTLNAAILTTAGYTKTNSLGAAAAISATAASAGVKTTGDGSIYVPGTNGEFSLFVGGRTSENSGALAEIGLLQNGGVGAGIASVKIPMLWEVADGTRAGIVPFTTDGQGASYGFEYLNTGANAVHTMLFAGGDFNGSIGPAVSAQQYIGTATAATGAAIVANSSMGFINVTKFHQVGPADLGGTGANLGSTYLRVAATFDLAGWDSAAGIQSWSGSSLITPAATTGPFTKQDTKATAIDGQMQGEVAGMPVGIYASYAKAPKSTLTSTNTYNGSTAFDRSAIVIATEWGVVPEKVTVGAAYRNGKSGVADASGKNATDNSVMLEGSYKLAQNMLLQLVYTKQSGGFWTQANVDAIGSQQIAFNLATIF